AKAPTSLQDQIVKKKAGRIAVESGSSGRFGFKWHRPAHSSPKPPIVSRTNNRCNVPSYLSRIRPTCRHLPIEEIHQVRKKSLSVHLQVQRHAVSHPVDQEGFMGKASLASPCIDLFGSTYRDCVVLLPVDDQ